MDSDFTNVIHIWACRYES